MTTLDDELKQRLHEHQEAVRAGMATDRRIESAVALVTLADDDKYRDCPTRICLYDKLINAYQALDATGYAEEIAAVSETLEPETTPGDSCFYCMRTARIHSSRLLGRTDEADALWRDASVVAPSHSIFDMYYVPLMDSERIWLAMDTGDVETSEVCMARIVDRLQRLEKAPRRSDSYQMAYDNARELRNEMAVIHALVLGDVEAATLEYDRGAARDDQSIGRVQVQLALAEALTAVDNPRADSLLADAQQYMDTRDRPRDRCRIYLAQAARASSCGDDAAHERAMRAAAEQLPRLKSRDLHATFAELRDD